MKIHSVLLMTTAFLAVACGRSPELTVSDGIRRDPTPDQIESARTGTLSCRFQDECEPAVAMISVATPGGVSRCTGFLVSDRKVLTNDHCLESLDSEKEECENLVFVHFNDEVHRGCKKILSRSHSQGIESQDYALIELSAPVKDRRPLRISRRGFLNGEKATAYHVQPSAEGQKLNGIQLKTACQASYSSILNVNIASPQDPLMTFGDCPIQAGNSGSPMLNSQGEVGSVLQGKVSPSNEEWQKEIEPFLLDGGYGEVAVGSQIRCMPEISGIPRNQCREVRPFSTMFPKEYLQEYGVFQSSGLPWISTELGWTQLNSSTQYERQYVTTPKCISRMEARLARYSFTSTVMSYRLGINSRLQSEWRPKNKAGEIQTLFRLKTETSGGTNFRPSVLIFESDLFGRIELPVCL